MPSLHLRRAIAICGLAAALSEAAFGYLAQTYPPGQYPPGQYPPGQYPPYPDNRIPATIPGGPTIGIPIPEIKLPRRKEKEKSKEQTAPEAKAPAPPAATLRAVAGRLRLIGEKELLLETEKHGILRFRLLGKTQFRDAKGEPMRDSLLKPGDQISVRFNPIDEETILSVHLLRQGTAAERAEAAKPVAPSDVRTAENLEGDAAPAVAAEAESSSESRPVLTRRTVDADYNDTVMPASDAVIEAARQQADAIDQALPNFLVQQQTTRYVGTVSPPNWHARDLVTAEVAYVNGAEEYRDIRVNGRPVTKPEQSGSWSTGEFGTTLQDVLSPMTGAAFSRRTDQLLGSRAMAVYDFVVPRIRSHWTIVAPDGATYKPAYKGMIWIDKETHHVRRIESESISLPEDFPFAKAGWLVEYDAVKVDNAPYMLAVRADNWSCERASSRCKRNETVYRNYRKFGAESEIKYEKFRSVVD